MGCILGPLGDDLELPSCSQHDDSNRHALGERLHDGLAEVDTALQKIRVRKLWGTAYFTRVPLLHTRLLVRPTALTLG